MKIGEAKKTYQPYLSDYWESKCSLDKQQKELKEKHDAGLIDQKKYESEAATLELSYSAVSKQYDAYSSFMEQLMELHSALFNNEATKQQGEAIQDEFEDEAKILEVARRIAKGGKVPSEDEKKLMDYSMELYMSAKNAAMMLEMQKRNKKHKEYESLWEDEEKKNNPDPNDVADNGECTIALPEKVSVDQTIATATSGIEASE